MLQFHLPLGSACCRSAMFAARQRRIFSTSRTQACFSIAPVFQALLGQVQSGEFSQKSDYKIDCKFNKEAIAKSIRGVSLLLQKVDIKFGDGITFIANLGSAAKQHSLAYVDPPYVANGHKLYRYYFTHHQHEKLSRTISNLQIPWMLSYDNHKIVRDLYHPDLTSTVSAFHAIRGSKLVDELLRFSAAILKSGTSTGSIGRTRTERAEGIFSTN